jgi:hypothetical protein
MHEIARMLSCFRQQALWQDVDRLADDQQRFHAGVTPAGGMSSG